VGSSAITASATTARAARVGRRLGTETPIGRRFAGYMIFDDRSGIVTALDPARSILRFSAPAAPVHEPDQASIVLQPFDLG
jgi:hypothetical protein